MQPRRRIEPQNSTKYSQWHSGDLGGVYPSYLCYAMDIDWIECVYLDDPTDPIPVAIIEEKQVGHSLTKLQSQLYPKIAKALDVPFYILRHNLETEDNRKNWRFELENERGQKLTLSEPEMADWLWKLRERKRLTTQAP